MIYLFSDDKQFRSEIIYSFRALTNILGISFEVYDNQKLKSSDIMVIYTSEDESSDFKCQKLYIRRSKKLFGANYLKNESLPQDIKILNNLISFYSDETINTIDINGKRIILEHDIISDTFFMLSRYEEYIKGNSKSGFERFDYTSSICYKNNIVKRPVVNEYAEMLLTLLQNLDKTINRKNIIDDKEFILFISHDIDSIAKYKDKILKVFLVKLIKERNFKSAIKCVNNYFRAIRDIKKDPYWTFEYLLELEKKYNYLASYYFMVGGNSTKDNYYNINNKKLKPVINQIKDIGSEIGLHGSFNSYNDIEMLKGEYNKLSKIYNISGIRQHFLRFKAPNTWNIQMESGFKYDTSVGYAEHVGFRCGTCTPYKPYDIYKRQVINIWEIPLIIMDSSLRDDRYGGLGKDESLKIAKELVETVKRHKGVLSVLWHNSSFDSEGIWDTWNEVYEEILDYSNKNNCIGLSGEKIIQLIKTQNY